ncbi:type II secretion system protein M [Pantoea sp. Tr-811]|uniref:type II secretion system protein GspM n=1 Tax=Pantoea sp. Tr-811 TaxID=2608361 RepID=UPI00141EF496|nr:type II secretion system protein GspM [Pantoea sp. Tr-811]NIF27588.1 type II secretion system protein M [Pantoea sp. Tr-811]
MSTKARLAQLQQRWQALAPRERRALLLAAGLLSLLFCWQVLIAPAMARLDHWAVETPKLRGQAQALDALLGQRPAQLDLQVLQQSLDQAGLPSTLHEEAPGQWILAWQQAPAEAAMAWLQQAPASLGVTISQLHVRRDPAASRSAATFSGTLRMEQAPAAKDPS